MRPMNDRLDFNSTAVQAGWLESMISWALHPERDRDAEYRLAELTERWQDYQSKLEHLGE